MTAKLLKRIDNALDWYNDIEDQMYLHVGCDEFEGDIKISSLSEENRERIKNCILCQ